MLLFYIVLLPGGLVFLLSMQIAIQSIFVVFRERIGQFISKNTALGGFFKQQQKAHESGGLKVCERFVK